MTFPVRWTPSLFASSPRSSSKFCEIHFCDICLHYAEHCHGRQSHASDVALGAEPREHVPSLHGTKYINVSTDLVQRNLAETWLTFSLRNWHFIRVLYNTFFCVSYSDLQRTTDSNKLITRPLLITAVQKCRPRFCDMSEISGNVEHALKFRLGLG